MLDLEKLKQAVLTFMQAKNDDEEAFTCYLATLNVHVILKLIEQNKALEADLETERLRLAACGVAALGYFDGCKDEYRSASLEDTLRLYESNKELVKQLAELKAENERLNTVPMKYRRMAFNAQLQKENEDLQFRNDRLVQDFADVTEENDALRRIHAENIEIFKRQLAEYKELLSNLMEVVEEPPESNCSCHISPPCSDCVEWSGLREALLEARTAMKGEKE